MDWRGLPCAEKINGFVSEALRIFQPYMGRHIDQDLEHEISRNTELPRLLRYTRRADPINSLFRSALKYFPLHQLTPALVRRIALIVLNAIETQNVIIPCYLNKTTQRHQQALALIKKADTEEGNPVLSFLILSGPHAGESFDKKFSWRFVEALARKLGIPRKAWHGPLTYHELAGFLIVVNIVRKGNHCYITEICFDDNILNTLKYRNKNKIQEIKELTIHIQRSE